MSSVSNESLISGGNDSIYKLDVVNNKSQRSKRIYSEKSQKSASLDEVNKAKTNTSFEQYLKDFEELLSNDITTMDKNNKQQLQGFECKDPSTKSSESQHQVNFIETTHYSNLNKNKVTHLNISSSLQLTQPYTTYHNNIGTIPYAYPQSSYYSTNQMQKPIVYYPAITYQNLSMSPYTLNGYRNNRPYESSFTRPNELNSIKTISTNVNTQINKINNTTTGSSNPSNTFKGKDIINNDPWIVYLNDVCSKFNIIHYLCSHKGCKDIQKRQVEFSQEAAEYLLELIVNENGLFRIMTDPCANYIFQKAYEQSSKNIREKIIKNLIQTSLSAGTDVFGSHSIQSIILKVSSTIELTQLNCYLLQSYKLLCFNKNGVHIILKYLTQIVEDKRKNLNFALLSIINQLAINIFGVNVVRK